ncbi:MAG: D-lyxose/D-mannose family sugar isomerase [Phycisphaerales bacterium]|nr:MAG: D-lyxose/D-mannose family sugar isomerase [Phycisphaerales bacterium]
MKRSEINRLIDEAVQFAESLQFKLPPFARWSAEDWASKGAEADEIRNAHLGWDVTDFATGQFDRCGLVLFTIRNGDPSGATSRKSYCEKIMIIGEGRLTPMHFHYTKMEDIINRGGGVLICQVYNSTPGEGLADEPVKVAIDGVRKEFPAGAEVQLQPGESITLPPGLYHAFWAKPGTGDVLAGEVSAVNDDEKDNRFLEPISRFPAIEEDEPAKYLLCGEYPPACF